MDNNSTHNKQSLEVSECYKNLSAMLAECFPDVCLTDNARIVNHDTYAEVTIQLAKQQVLEDFVDALDKRMGLNILYAQRNSQGSEYHAMAYSTPYRNEMFLIVMHSCQYGLISSVTAELFDSLEIMFRFVKKCMLDIRPYPWITLERERPEVMFSNFI